MKPCSLLLWLATVMVAVVWPGVACGAMRGFSAGTLIIPVDPCWQPVSDQAVATGCSTGGSLVGAAGAYGLVYRLQRAGIPVFQVENGVTLADEQPAFVIHGGGNAPVTLLPGGTALDPPSRVGGTAILDAHLIDYRGRPFLVDGGELDTRSAPILAGYPEVRRHLARLPFSAPVSRVLTGLPTSIKVSESGAAALETALNFAAINGDNGLAVLLPGTPDPTASEVPLSGCSGDAVLGSPLEGPCGLPALFDDLATVPSTTPTRETVTIAPLVADAVLFAGSAEFPGLVGHLRALALFGSRQTRLWDAAAAVPLPGSALPSPSDPGLAALAPQFSARPAQRVVFTNLDASRGYRLLSLDAAASYVLQPLLGVGSVDAAAALINAVRGRSGVTAAVPAGVGDRANRLGGISRSTPALVGGSPLVEGAGRRDQVLYVGGEDGLLHAVLAGRWLTAESRYDHAADGCGQELWAYLPGSFLPALVHQPFAPSTGLPAVHVDGSPIVSDLFIDGDGDGGRAWRTVLVGTGSDQRLNRGVVFALDVTEPLAPRLIWEKALSEIDLGRSRGAALGWLGTWADAAPRVFLTAGTASRQDVAGVDDPVNGRHGVIACALDLTDGSLLWQFAAPYPEAAGNLAEPPTSPSLMKAAAGGGVDGLIFGDLAGRLWVLHPESGAPLGGLPVWQAPGGTAEPIGGGIALRNRLVLFGTGGVAYAEEAGHYAVYAVEILPEGGRLLWRMPLLPGEKVWGAPSFDRFGRACLGVGAEQDAGGRLLQIAADGVLADSVALTGAPVGGVTLVPGAMLTISSSGEVM